MIDLKICSFLFTLLLPALTWAQSELSYEDQVYDPQIQTVQLYAGADETQYPILFLGQQTQLTLEFDELIDPNLRESDFTVDLVSCNADWEPSYILPIEFYEGFAQDRISDFERSQHTKVFYIHYTYRFPQEREGFKLSGNYLLKVYRGNDPHDLVLTRRFLVVDRRISVEPKYLLNDRIERLRLAEFGFEVNTGNLKVFNPAQDLEIRMLQNFRWDQALALRQPRFQRDNVFEYQVDLSRDFSGGNEFRQLDIRSTRFYSEAMQDVEERPEAYRVFLFPDKPRLENTFFGNNRRDLNGDFFVAVQEWPYPDYQADYVFNFFTLETRNQLPGDVYLMGHFSDWQLSDYYRMAYNPDLKRYELDLLLKQGVYDYTYGFLPEGAPHADEIRLEGSRFETENYYTLLVYYKGISDRNHQLLGFLSLNGK